MSELNLLWTPAFNGVFLFYLNKLGCVGSLLISIGITLVLLFLFGVLR